MNKKLELAIKKMEAGVKREEQNLQNKKDSFAALNADIQKGYIPVWSSIHGELVVAKERLDRAIEMLEVLKYIADDNQ